MVFEPAAAFGPVIHRAVVFSFNPFQGFNVPRLMGRSSGQPVGFRRPFDLDIAVSITVADPLKIAGTLGMFATVGVADTASFGATGGHASISCQSFPEASPRA